MKPIKYKLLNKRENENGVSLTFEQKTQAIKPETFWDKFLTFFGNETGKVVEEISEFDVFYPVKLGVHFKTSLCYADGSPISYETVDHLTNLIEISKFKEQPIKEFVKKD